MIVGYAEVMRDIEGENTPENMQVIIDEAKRLSVLVNDLLEISRIQGGISQRNDEVFVLEEVVTETVDRYRRLKAEAGFSFLCEAEGESKVRADKSKLLQVICNLLNNAIHYSDEKKQIEVRVFRVENACRVEVKDYGVGIAEEDLPNVWQRYYKVDKVHRRSSAGSGLGLSIVREILEMHHACYGVSSKVGEGSLFWFSLPIEKELSLTEPPLSLPPSL
jgi:signal transduction histidine kinase